MTKKNNKKGFTLAELLVVVAIIAVLVAVSIPIFTAQLQKARVATNQANARAAKAEAVAEFLTAKDSEKSDAGALYTTYDVSKGTSVTSTTAPKGGADLSSQIIEDWTTTTTAGSVKLGDKTLGTWYVTVAKDGAVTYKAE